MCSENTLLSNEILKKLRCYVIYAPVSVPTTDTQSAGGRACLPSGVVCGRAPVAISRQRAASQLRRRRSQPTAIIRCKFDAIRLDSCVRICRRSRVSSPRAQCVHNARSMTSRISEATKVPFQPFVVPISSNLHEVTPNPRDVTSPQAARVNIISYHYTQSLRKITNHD